MTRAYGYYNMASYISQAVGNLACGAYISWAVSSFGGKRQDYFIQIIYLYAIVGALKGVAYCFLSSEVEADPEQRKVKQIVNVAGLTAENTKVIVMLSLLFMVDSFAGGFVAQAFLSYYYEKKYDF